MMKILSRFWEDRSTSRNFIGFRKVAKTRQPFTDALSNNSIDCVFLVEGKIQKILTNAACNQSLRLFLPSFCINNGKGILLKTHDFNLIDCLNNPCRDCGSAFFK
ncbi:hypothetical protein ACOME3_009800 [Neoechinorhynchus agilis]